MTAATLMIQGTASSVGKSIITAGLCRLLRNRGLRVAPFKSQNMALNAYVTEDGGEIGRAQAVQARAAGIEPTVDMNPILLKPEAESRSQVVVMGKPLGSLAAVDYQARKGELREIVRGSLARLRSSYDVVVIEGAGSPAEVNLKPRDIVNMFVAEIADAPVLLVGDIDRGGVFAAFVGTLELLEPGERARVAGFLINKFRGDVRLLDSGLEFLEQRTAKRVFGVIPYVRDLQIADEDSVALEERRRRRRARRNEIEIAVVLLPSISNYDDFQPLEHEPGVVVRFVEHPAELDGADLAVLPGTKSTLADLAYLRRSGFAEGLQARARAGEWVLGICGGCQMLGRNISDPAGVEASAPAQKQGLGLLSFDTEFGLRKRTTRTAFRVAIPNFLCESPEARLAGYEIHMGRLRPTLPERAAFRIQSRTGESDADAIALDGEVSSDGNVVGTMMHGLFENEVVRRTLIGKLRARRGLPEVVPPEPANAYASAPVLAPDPFDRLADHLAAHIDTRAIFRLIGR
ncbi:MAG TPA: cobyric acid synthase [Polyangiaceae bacterium]|nr:cobyric acid synthase [Polyangiaceae bacterium]